MAYNPSMYGYGGYQQLQQTGFYPQQATPGMVWVDGEMEAKARPIPAGASQFAMWDINEPVIYIKSLNPMGIPNPLRKIHYQVDEQQKSGESRLMSGEEEKNDTAQYVSRDELQSMKDEIVQAIREMKEPAKRTVKGEQA